MEGGHKYKVQGSRQEIQKVINSGKTITLPRDYTIMTSRSFHFQVN
jgi:hypothetical protein